MTNKVQTTKIGGGADYAKVANRLKKWREDNPRGLSETSFEYQVDGSVTFQAHLLNDKANKNSGEATGTAMYTAAKMKTEKAFEKLETIAVGRALSMLGYLADGEIAGTEELAEFHEFQQAKVDFVVQELEAAKDLDELKLAWNAAGKLITDSRVIEAKDKRKKELTEGTNNAS